MKSISLTISRFNRALVVINRCSRVYLTKRAKLKDLLNLNQWFEHNWYVTIWYTHQREEVFNCNNCCIMILTLTSCTTWLQSIPTVKLDNIVRYLCQTSTGLCLYRQKRWFVIYLFHIRVFRKRNTFHRTSRGHTCLIQNSVSFI